MTFHKPNTWNETKEFFGKCLEQKLSYEELENIGYGLPFFVSCNFL